jgi:hypothetical protein
VTGGVGAGRARVAVRGGRRHAGEAAVHGALADGVRAKAPEEGGDGGSPDRWPEGDGGKRSGGGECRRRRATTAARGQKGGGGGGLGGSGDSSCVRCVRERLGGEGGSARG